MRPKLDRSVLGYLLAGVAMLLCLLYLRFPGEAINDYLRAAASARYPGLEVSIDAIRPSVPAGILFSNVTVGSPTRPEATLHADRLNIRPGVLPLLKGRLAFLLTAEGYGGEAEGRVDFSRLFAAEGPFRAEADVRNLNVEKCAWLREVLGHRITGTLKATAAFSGSTEAPKNGSGDLEFTVANGSYPLNEGFLGIDKLDFRRIDGKVALRSGTLKVNQLTLAGDRIRGSLKGNVVLADVFLDSQIDLSGVFEIPLQGTRRMTLAISGTLRNPVTRLQ